VNKRSNKVVTFLSTSENNFGNYHPEVY